MFRNGQDLYAWIETDKMYRRSIQYDLDLTLTEEISDHMINLIM